MIKENTLTLFRHSVEEDFYRRAVRQPLVEGTRGDYRLVFELNSRTRLWHNISVPESEWINYIKINKYKKKII
jgi:hypothetical protein